jgi:hypothetical protein
MKLAGWVSIGSIASAGLLAALPGGDFAREIWLGMMGPAVAVITAWLVVERTNRKHPDQLTGVQARLFFGKMLFFGAYVAGVLGTGIARPYPFMVTFTAYFVLLYGIHAFALHRLVTAGAEARRP